jgi:hypothetical protein
VGYRVAFRAREEACSGMPYTAEAPTKVKSAPSDSGPRGLESLGKHAVPIECKRRIASRERSCKGLSVLVGAKGLAPGAFFVSLGDRRCFLGLLRFLFGGFWGSSGC